MAGLNLIPNGRVRLYKHALLQCPVFPAESNTTGINAGDTPPIRFAARAMQDVPPFHQDFRERLWLRQLSCSRAGTPHSHNFCLAM